MAILPKVTYRLNAAAAAKSLQSCPTLCDPIDRSPRGSSVPGILQARTLEWVAISFSNVWKWKVRVKLLSHIRLLATAWTAAHQTPLSMGFSRQEYWSGVPLPSPHYEATNGIFHRTRTNNFTIFMEIQKTLNSQSNLEKEEWNRRNQPAWLQSLLQSHSHQDSMVLAQSQKYRSIEQSRKPRDKPTHLWTLYLWQRMQAYTMEKRQSF